MIGWHCGKSTLVVVPRPRFNLRIAIPPHEPERPRRRSANLPHIRHHAPCRHSAGGIEDISEFDAALFRVIEEVADGEVTMFPGLADVKTAMEAHAAACGFEGRAAPVGRLVSLTLAELKLAKA